MTPDQLDALYCPRTVNHVTSYEFKAGLAKVRADSWSPCPAFDGDRQRAGRDREPLKPGSSAVMAGTVIATATLTVGIPRFVG